MNEKILIIEDDEAIAAIERDYLTANGFAADVSADGTNGLELALSGTYALILLDLMLPGTDGFTLCKKLREKSDVPVLMVTARLDDADKIRGLGCGADDYIEKPFSPAVLLARIRANIAEYKRLKPASEKPAPVLTAGKISIEKETKRVFIDGKEIELKNREYELLLFLVQHPRQSFSCEDLYGYIWGLESLGDNKTVAVHINRIREKIEKDPANPVYIRTVWGSGYRFIPG